MTRPQQVYGLIAYCQTTTRRELVILTGWTAKKVDKCLEILSAARALRIQNINGRRHYLIA